jgi:iron-sulfur cluster assembly accessory protein
MQIQLTDTALTKVQSFLNDHGAGEEAGLRVAVLPGGCSGFQYGLTIEDTPDDEDEILDLSQTVLTDPTQEKAPLCRTPR